MISDHHGPNCNLERARQSAAKNSNPQVINNYEMTENKQPTIIRIKVITLGAAECGKVSRPKNFVLQSIARYRAAW